MKTLIQKYPLNWFGQTTFQINESDIIQSHKSLWGSWERPFPLKDISPITGKIVVGNKAWDNFGSALFGAGVVLGFIHLFIVFDICVLLGAACFLVRFTMRDTFIAFSSKESNNFLFSIRISKSDVNAENFIEELKKAVVSN